MSDEVSAFQVLVHSVSAVYAENKAIISFIGGAITFGIPHAYKLYKFFADRQDLKDKIREELIDEAYKNRVLVQNAADVILEMKFKAQSGLYWRDSGGAVSIYLHDVERDKVRPAVEAAEDFYIAVSNSDSLSLKELKSYRVRAKKDKYANELVLSEVQVRLRDYGVKARLIG